jgi:NTP pyrophosphatase (non-canonical NTP hydrolase)
MKKEAREELADTIEDVFYIADLLRQAGEPQAARRVGELGSKLYAELESLTASMRSPVRS